MNDYKFEELDYGIRYTVRWLQDHNFKTTDSGDGISKKAAIADGEALDYPHVFMSVDPRAMIHESHRLKDLLEVKNLLEKASIEASYDPYNEIAIIALINIDDNDLLISERKK